MLNTPRSVPLPRSSGIAPALERAGRLTIAAAMTALFVFGATPVNAQSNFLTAEQIAHKLAKKKGIRRTPARVSLSAISFEFDSATLTRVRRIPFFLASLWAIGPPGRPKRAQAVYRPSPGA